MTQQAGKSCLLRPDGTRGQGGCAREAGHDGPCDNGASFWPRPLNVDAESALRFPFRDNPFDAPRRLGE